MERLLWNQDVLKGVLFETTKKAADPLCGVKIMADKKYVAFIRCDIMRGNVSRGIVLL